jgi:uncharacterized membrane protein (DUF485 family)
MKRFSLSSEGYHRLHMCAGLVFLCSLFLTVYLVIFKLAPAFAWCMGTPLGSYSYEAKIDMVFSINVLVSFVSYVLMTMAMRMSNTKRREENARALFQGKCA